MTDNYERFYEMINRFPAVSGFWDQQNHKLNTEELQSSLGVLSSGQRRMALFFASVWNPADSEFSFDLVDAASGLDQQSREIIIKWLHDPFYP